MEERRSNLASRSASIATERGLVGAAIVERIKNLRSCAPPPEIISVDRVLDAESIEQAR